MIRDLVIELISPLILGGAEKGRCDAPPTLRPPSLRGQLRFWSRALGGKELEERLWGTTETGQRIRILGAQPLSKPGEAYLFPHKPQERKSRTDMIPPGERVLVRFALPSPDLLEPAQAAVWTWLHLGTVGRRSRRGYGAFVWEPQAGDLLEGFLPGGFDRGRDLAGPAELAGYLSRGLDRVFAALGVPPEASRSSRPSTGDFALRSPDQVFVGNRLTVADGYQGDRRYRWHLERGVTALGPNDAGTSLESLLHGLDPGARGDSDAPERKQLGLPQPRLPSPMIWRLHPCSAGGHLPVMVWSPVDYPRGDYPQLHVARAANLCRYLSESLGFGDSLAGNALTV